MDTTIFCAQRDQVFKTAAPGVEFSVLRRHTNGAGVTLLFRMEKGAHAARHDHPGGEETYMISGKLRVGERTLAAGDYLWTQPGEIHDGYAEEACEFFVVLPGGLDVKKADTVPDLPPQAGERRRA